VHIQHPSLTWEGEHPRSSTIFLARGYQNITVLDISETAIDATKKRLGTAAEHVSWFVGDITKISARAKRLRRVARPRAVFTF